MSKRLIAVHAQDADLQMLAAGALDRVGRRLRDGLRIVILGGPAQALSRSSAYLTAPQGWDKQVAILAHAAAFVGIDSCFSHVADTFNVPGLVLYGDAAATAQWRPNDRRLGR